MMNLSTLPRPGVRWGSRPERVPDIEPNALERWLQARVRARRRAPHHFHQFAGSARQIHRQANALTVMNKLDRLRARRNLRTSEAVESHDPAHVIDVFAHIRLECQALYDVTLHDEQLYAGWKMLQGHMVQMGTGEGKTLVAALPAIVSALSGTPVHVLTANDFLAQRDSQMLAPLYQRFGLSVASLHRQDDRSRRRDAYAHDITYAAGKEIVFDYLRDQHTAGEQAHGLGERLHRLVAPQHDVPVQRGLCLAIVDEADNVLIDEARVPIVLSGMLPKDHSHRSQSVVAITIARLLHTDVDFTMVTGDRTVHLTMAGQAAVRAQTESLPGVWRFERYRQELVRQALIALHLFKLDQHYFIADGKVVLIDESTGRPMPDRRLQQGLHQMLEVKERCKPGDNTDVMAAISFQQFLRRYHGLCGMSGTLQPCAAELRSIYHKPLAVIPPHRSSQLTATPARIVVSRPEQLEQLAVHLRELVDAGRAVLIGSRSVAVSEQVSRHLHSAGIEHALLNARQDADEAQVVRQAGRSGKITVATNMAGRGTDITLDAASRAAGGLHVINLELNDSPRIDRQLFGRAGRQGDPGSCESLLSLEDPLIEQCLPTVVRMALRSGLQGQWPMATVFARLAFWYTQRIVESRHRTQRAQLSRAPASLLVSLAKTE